MKAALPRFSSGLKLIRIGVFVMLLQLGVGLVVTIKGAISQDVAGVHEWVSYFFLANIAAVAAMLFAVVRALPELARARVDTRGLVIAAAGFAIATAAFGWSHYAISSFVDVVLDPKSTLDQVEAAATRVETVRYMVILKDLAYAAGLIAVIRTVRASAIVNDQLALRDVAGSMSRALIVMLVADLFYQVAYGNGSVGILGLLGSLCVGGYWIWCHVKLQRFLANAAWFMNEPHVLPIARVVGGAAEAPPARPSQVAPRPSAPAVRTSQPAPPIIVAPPPPSTPTPRARSTSDADGPRFLK